MSYSAVAPTREPDEFQALRSLEESCGLEPRGGVLGSGASSVVFRVVGKDGSEFAAKVMRDSAASRWDIEMHGVAAARCPLFVAPLVHVLYVDGWLISVTPILRPIFGRERADDMRECLRALHDAGIAHGDVHIGNFMMDPCGGRVRLIDFGLSHDYFGRSCGDLPPVPRGLSRPTDEWGWLVLDRNVPESVRVADFFVDLVKLENAISML